ncbi:MAG: hypothetical protein PHF19_09715 [Synergistales bacterium]|nr:hypothetical protein [Synergistales bacterium]
MEESRKLICSRCQVEMTPAKAYFSYLDHSFHTDLLRCPRCGQVFIPEELVKGKMQEVEMALEDK